MRGDGQRVKSEMALGGLSALPQKQNHVRPAGARLTFGNINVFGATDTLPPIIMVQ